MKKLLLIIMTFVVMISVASCGGIGNGTGDGAGDGNDGSENVGGGEYDAGDGDEGENKPTKPLVWDYNTDVYLVSDIKKSEKQSISDKFTNLTGGNYLLPYSEDKAKRDHEVVIGPSERPVAKEAYEYLDYLMENGAQYEDAVNFVIYVKDGSLAIAYSDDAAYKYAINAFYEHCFIEENYYADNGPVYWEQYSLEAMAERNREKMYDEGFAKLKSQLIAAGATNADAIIKELRNYYSFISTDQLYWMANLYDPEVGAFYHCNSAKASESSFYLPDLESTNQILLMLDRGGLFKPVVGRIEGGGSDLPDFIKVPLAEWVKSLQSSEDGMFYHPQWGKNIGDAQYGRDLEAATTLLRITGAKPYYNDPTGNLMGTLGAPGPNATPKPASALAMRLNNSTVSAVSYVTSVSSNLPKHLQSLDAWKAYVDKFDINNGSGNKSYYAGHSLASQAALIKAAGPEYVKYAIDYLNEHQYADIGLWEYQNEIDYDPNDRVGFNGTNGLMKISTFYTIVGEPVPNAYNALKSVIKVGLYRNTKVKEETVCYTLNIWDCISSMLRNIKTCDPDNFDAAKALVIENLPEILISAYNLQSAHLMADGGFNYYETKSKYSFSNKVAKDVLESDTDSTMVVTTSTVDRMYNTLKLLFGESSQITQVPFWCADDYYLFINELRSAEKTEKK